MIRKWYMRNYPTDDLGSEISKTADWLGLLETMFNRKSVYDYLCVGDSVIRERVFSKLSQMLGCDYGKIYDLWLES